MIILYNDEYKISGLLPWPSRMGITTVKSMQIFLNYLEVSLPSSYRSLSSILRMSLSREDLAYFKVKICNCGSLCQIIRVCMEIKVQLHQHRPQFYRSTKHRDILAVKNSLSSYQKQIKLVPLKLCEAQAQFDCNVSIIWGNFTSAYSYQIFSIFLLYSNTQP